MAPTRLICIVDDSLAYHSVFQELFYRYLSYYQVRFFTTEKAFLEELHHLRSVPAAVLLDHKLAKATHYQLQATLKAHTHNVAIPVVIMSEHIAPEELANVYAAGVNCFFIKEQTVPSLRETLASLLFDLLERTSA